MWNSLWAEMCREGKLVADGRMAQEEPLAGFPASSGEHLDACGRQTLKVWSFFKVFNAPVSFNIPCHTCVPTDFTKEYGHTPFYCTFLF